VAEEAEAGAPEHLPFDHFRQTARPGKRPTRDQALLTWQVLLELAATGPSATPVLPGQEHLFTPGSIRGQPG
jgi:hypothetical protein